MLRRFGYVDKENNTNKALLYKLMNESNTGYVFENDNERGQILQLVENFTKIDEFVDTYCYQAYPEHWQRPLHPNVYCPRGRMPGVSMSRYCSICRNLCKYDSYYYECTILKTNETDFCSF